MLVRCTWSARAAVGTRRCTNHLQHHLNSSISNGARQHLWKCLPTSVRGAKTKSIVKADDLIQGLLPSSLDVERAVGQDDEDAPAYPRVIQQHINNVKKFSNCVVLTRVGNFYEMYAEQADEYGPLLNLKVAQKKTSLGPVSMAGFQYGQLDRYLKVLVQTLHKQVAISEEVRHSEADQARHGGLLYTRRVSRVITAGTLIDENFVDPYENNFLLSIHVELEPSELIAALFASIQSQQSVKVGLAWVDLSSGDFFTQSTDLASLSSVVARIGAREVVLDSCFEELDQSGLSSLLGDADHALTFHDLAHDTRSISRWLPMLESSLSASEQSKFTSEEVNAGSVLLDYVRGRLFELNISLQRPIRRTEDENMGIDKQTLRSLEIRSTLRDGVIQGSLLHAIRRTVTKSGARLLNRRLVSPSMSLPVINERLDLISELLQRTAVKEDIEVLLRRTSDIWRLLQKFSIGRGDADDLIALAKSIETVTQIANIVNRYSSPHTTSVDASEDVSSSALETLLNRLDMDAPTKIAKRILNTIDEDSLSQQHQVEEAHSAEVANFSSSLAMEEDGAERSVNARKTFEKASGAASPQQDIWIMRKSASPTLSSAHNTLGRLFDEKEDLSNRLREELGLKSLSLKWTPQLGHFCHVRGKDVNTSLSSASNINATRTTRTFYLRDWTQLGSQIEEVKSRIRTEEQRVFDNIRKQIIRARTQLRRNATILDELDVACSSATLAKERNLVRPILHAGTSHNVVGGRHPTVDVGLLEHGRRFTPNDCSVGNNEAILLITGPNMAGKSTYLRQNALISILAQTGCYVPAEYAEIGLVDKIFSRVGSADNLYNHQSTFMIEMLEVAEILNQATPRSFVIMDEVGRGTTPEDGIAVSFACLHHLHYKSRCRTLFATHFHSLVDMTRAFERVACYCTDVAENADGSWAYVHRLRRGVNRESHALKVARLAGLPEESIKVAQEVLEGLQRKEPGGLDEVSLDAKA